MPKPTRSKQSRIPGSIPFPPPTRVASISFSFQHLDFANPKFHHTKCRDGYLPTLVERLRDLSGWTPQEFRDSRSHSIKSNKLRWNDTTEPNGFFPGNEQLRGYPAYEFSLSVNEHGRIHGFFIDSIFFVVWLDPDHLLYP